MKDYAPVIGRIVPTVTVSLSRATSWKMSIPCILSRPIIFFWKSRYKIVQEILHKLVLERQAQPDKYLSDWEWLEPCLSATVRHVFSSFLLLQLSKSLSTNSTPNASGGCISTWLCNHFEFAIIRAVLDMPAFAYSARLASRESWQKKMAVV